MLTLTAPGVRIAGTLDTIERELMGLQTFGSYPAWAWNDDEGEWEGWAGQYWDQPGSPRLTVEDLPAYAAWSLDIPEDQVQVHEVEHSSERMSPVSFQSLREFLGLTIEETAQRLAVNPRTIRSWEQGRSPIPYAVPTQIHAIADRAAAIVADLVDEIIGIRERGGETCIVAYRTDSDLQAAHPDSALTARQWRNICARAISDAGDGEIVGPNDDPDGRILLAISLYTI